MVRGDNCCSFERGVIKQISTIIQALLSIFGKLFLGVILQRLNNAISQFEILEENEIGFKKGYQTLDHIFYSMCNY